MKPHVAIVKTDEGKKMAVQEAIKLLGGIEGFVKPSISYLVKPNLFTTIPSDAGATTDIEIFMTVAELIKQAGGKPVVGECPATASYTRPDVVFDGLGVRETCVKAGVEINVLDREEPFNVKNSRGEVLNEFWFPKFAIECGGIFNVPKLKTHTLTKMTCALKNLFGLQQGGIKAHHHVLTGNDPESFSRLLVDIYECIKSHVSLNIVDAVVAMEGEGPTTGDLVDLGLVIAGEDVLAVDIVATAIMGWDPLEVGTSYIAAQRGLGPESIDDIKILGLPIEEATIPFKKPQTYSNGQNFIEVRMPIECNEDKCTNCGICVKVCPVKAITMHNKPTIKDDRCIQCFCCIELCPSGALRARRRK
jgi:uncharacterized protein (DUF362 family)